MGKPEDLPVAEENPVERDLACKRTPWRQIVTLVLGFHLLTFAILSFSFFSRSTKHASSESSIPLQAHIRASFWLQKPFWMINSSLSRLETDLQSEVGVPNSQVVILSIQPLHLANWTEVVFGVVSEPFNTSLQLADISLLRETFVELFLEQSVNLSLSTDVFGKAYHFEVLAFPGGVTVVPEQSGFPLQVVVLFNFTLHNTLSRVVHNFAKFKQQLAAGISLKANESLFVQLTNFNGSTLERPIIIQTSIMPVVGLMLPTPRLKQLAQAIAASPRGNLGLNHTLFGSVRGIELSSYLEHTLSPAEVPSPAPSPSFDGCKQTPSYVPAPEKPPWYCSWHHHHHHHHHYHHHHHHKAGAPTSHSLSPSQRRDYHSPALAPSTSPYFLPNPTSLSPEIPPSYGYNSPEPISSSAPIVSPPDILPHPLESPPTSSPSPFSAQGPPITFGNAEPTPAVGPAPLQDPELKDFIPALSPSSSEALNFPYWITCLPVALLIMFW